MKAGRPLITAIVAGAVGVICFFSSVKDGGNVDFYWKPMLVVWYALTGVAFVPLGKKKVFEWLRTRWWLQLAAPVALLAIAALLVRVHAPLPLKHATKRANQSPEPMRMLVTPAADAPVAPTTRMAHL